MSIAWLLEFGVDIERTQGCRIEGPNWFSGASWKVGVYYTLKTGNIEMHTVERRQHQNASSSQAAGHHGGPQARR